MIDRERQGEGEGHGEGERERERERKGERDTEKRREGERGESERQLMPVCASADSIVVNAIDVASAVDDCASPVAAAGAAATVAVGY